jgi:branched-chain amino acid transport system substrate-binding protein
VFVAAIAWIGLIVVSAQFLGLNCSAGNAPKRTIEIGYVGSELADEYSQPSPDNEWGAAFAIARARAVRGFTLTFVPLDDTFQGAWSPDKALEDMGKLVSDSRVLGVVGPLRAPESWQAVPIANGAQLAVISPTNTDPCLTKSLDYCRQANRGVASLRPTGKNNYFRIAADETLLGRAMADFAYTTLGLRKFAVWDDRQANAGEIEADAFSAEFEKAGGSVVARMGFDVNNQTTPDFRPWLQEAKAAGAQAIYAGAWNHQCVARQQSQGIFDPSSYYLGPDGAPDLFSSGMTDQECVSDAGVMANDHLYASRGLGNANLNSRSAATIAAYLKAYPDPAGINAHTFADYDCAALLIDAIGRAIDGNGGRLPTRQQVVDQLAKNTNFQGLTGTYTFDALGDPTTPTLQILQYKTGGWSPIKNITVATS